MELTPETFAIPAQHTPRKDTHASWNTQTSSHRGILRNGLCNGPNQQKIYNRNSHPDKQLPVQFLAKQQPVVAKSTCEAEYISTAEATTLTLWIRNLVQEIYLPTQLRQLHVENTAAVQMAKSMGGTKRRKCIDVRNHYLHETVKSGKIEIKRILTEQQYADIFTNPLKAKLCNKHKEKNKINKIRKPRPRFGECSSLQNPEETLRQTFRTENTAVTLR